MSVSGSNQGVRFGVATSTNRPATPFDGQVIYETDTDRIAAYDSSAWAYKSGDSGLVLVTSGTATSGTTITLDSVFSADYDNYKIVLDNVNHGGTTNVLQWRTGGATDANASYAHGRSYLDVTAMAWEAGNSGTATSWAFGNTIASVDASYEIMVFNPFTANQTEALFRQVAFNTVKVMWLGFHTFNGTTSFDGFIFTAGGTIATANYAVYGMRK